MLEANACSKNGARTFCFKLSDKGGAWMLAGTLKQEFTKVFFFCIFHTLIQSCTKIHITMPQITHHFNIGQI